MNEDWNLICVCDEGGKMLIKEEMLSGQLLGVPAVGDMYNVVVPKISKTV